MDTPLVITTDDGLALEGERRSVDAALPTRCAAVLCHPHPSFGGTMRSLVISPLFHALPKIGVDCLRFNFRGVEASQGSFREGVGERLDVEAAIAAHRSHVGTDMALVVIGFSFGADLALATESANVAGWCAIAPPLRFCSDADVARRARDPRPTSIVLGALDDIRDPNYVANQFNDAAAVSVTIIPGASHFFVGRDAQMITAVSEFIDQVTNSRLS